MYLPFTLSALLMLTATLLRFPKRVGVEEIVCSPQRESVLDVEHLLADSPASPASSAADIISLFFS